MLVHIRHCLTGKLISRELPITAEQLRKYLNDEDFVQRIFPELSVDDREFLLTGISEEEWDKNFKEDEL